RYLGLAAFFLTCAAAAIAFYLSARRGVGPGVLLGESWSLMVLVAVLVLVSMVLGFLFIRLAQRLPDPGREKPPAGAGGDVAQAAGTRTRRPK
ncbi:MAG TPA: hypothetical protein VIL08_04605, partial [Limnochorda sp.]